MTYYSKEIWLVRSENHHQVFKMTVIIIMYLHISAIYCKNYCIFVYLIINTLKWPSKISKLCYVVFSRRKIKQNIPNIQYCHIWKQPSISSFERNLPPSKPYQRLYLNHTAVAARPEIGLKNVFMMNIRAHAHIAMYSTKCR